ncbi:Flp family type IVb pilin [Nostocoides sp. F2B08]|nr:Flp family type IVb pilin [Tetrasphaera sp. F2B08]KAB7741873.1 Flp family type IVb pilin [Tetrasphaera sp. F2B08]
MGRPDGEGGATAVEYAIMASLIAAVIVGVVTTLGNSVVALFNSAVAAF